MPARQGNVGGLVGKLGRRLQEAHEEHKNDVTELRDSGNLPPGIEDGVARLEDCEFQVIKEGKKNAGEYQFYASGIVVEPFEHTFEDPPDSGKYRTIKVEGKRTFIVEPMCDTSESKPNSKRKTVSDHLAFVYDIYRILGYDTSSMDYTDLEAVAEALRANKPYFIFRTWRGKATEQFPNPLVNHDWMRPVEDGYAPPENAEEVDNTAPPVPSRNGSASTPTAKSTPAPSRPASKAPSASKAPPTSEPASNEPEPNMEFAQDLDALAEMAKGKDGVEEVEDARNKLSELAIEAGKTEEEVDNADSWEEVVEWIREAEGNTEPEGEEEEEEPETLPKLKEVWKTRLTDPKTKVKSKKLTQVEIVKVDADKEVVDVKNLVDKKIYKGIPFAELVSTD